MKWSLLLALLLVSALAVAAEHFGTFGSMDRDGDGDVTFGEFRKAYPDSAGGFGEIAGPDMVITPDEWQEFRSAHQEAAKRYGPGFHDKAGPGHEQGQPPMKEQ